MRTDIDDRRDEIITWLSAGVSRREVCKRLACKSDTLVPRLRLWGVLHLKNKSGKGFPKYGNRGNLAEYLVNPSVIGSHILKLRLWKEGLKPKHCEECGWAVYSSDGRLPLELDHINGKSV